MARTTPSGDSVYRSIRHSKTTEVKGTRTAKVAMHQLSRTSRFRTRALSRYSSNSFDLSQDSLEVVRNVVQPVGCLADASHTDPHSPSSRQPRLDAFAWLPTRHVLGLWVLPGFQAFVQIGGV